METIGPGPGVASRITSSGTKPPIMISGIPVEFPFEPYECQRAYMEKVIMALQQRENALLESPTGTGKTLCLLCSALAWRESIKPYHLQQAPQQSSTAPPDSVSALPHERLALPSATAASYPSAAAAPAAIAVQGMHGNSSGDGGGGAVAGVAPRPALPTIIYSSRTHSQLAQVVKELRNTSYKDRVRSGILSSRNQTCLHPTISKLTGGAANQACRSAVSHKKCKWYNNLKFRGSNASKDWSGTLGAIPDIEDLVSAGRSHEVCPFYLGRDVATSADIIFMPYNYLLDPSMRRSLAENVNWTDAIVIFDEAHNVESVCSDSSSFDITAKQLTDAINEVKRAREACLDRLEQGINFADPISAGASDRPPADYRQLAQDLDYLQRVLKLVENGLHGLASQLGTDGMSRAGAWLFDFFSGFNITAATLPPINAAIDGAGEVLQEAEAMLGSTRAGGGTAALQHLQHCLNLVFSTVDPFKPGGPPAHKGYRVHIHMERSWGQDRLPAPTLSFWCFVPGMAFRMLRALGLRSVLLTSGTLAPLESFAQELQLPFPLRLENPHIIEPSQVWVGSVAQGPGSAPLNSSYQGRQDPRYRTDLGLLILNVSRIVPDGLLVFFPSYTMLDMCTTHWKETLSGTRTIWQQMSEQKAPVEEPKGAALFPAAIEEYQARLDDPTGRGAVFFAVCRGKVSEGLDFSDRAGRAVIITGIPFANSKDARVRLKREVLDEESRGHGATGRGGLTGEQWYVQQAMRAVNQAMGRVIRHRWDYGAIILADARFAQSNTTKQLSKWLQDYVVAYPSFGSAQGQLARFFKDKAGFAPPADYVSKGGANAAPAGRSRAAARDGDAGGGEGSNPFRFLGNAGASGVNRLFGSAGGRSLMDSVPAAFDVSGLGNLANTWAAARGGAGSSGGPCGGGGCGGGGGNGGAAGRTLLDKLEQQQQQRRGLPAADHSSGNNAGRTGSGSSAGADAGGLDSLLQTDGKVPSGRGARARSAVAATAAATMAAGASAPGGSARALAPPGLTAGMAAAVRPQPIMPRSQIVLSHQAPEPGPSLLSAAAGGANVVGPAHVVSGSASMAFPAAAAAAVAPVAVAPAVAPEGDMTLPLAKLAATATAGAAANLIGTSQGDAAGSSAVAVAPAATAPAHAKDPVAAGVACTAAAVASGSESAAAAGTMLSGSAEPTLAPRGAASMPAAPATPARADPRAFMEQLRAELPRDIMAAVEKLLASYRQHKDAPAFIEGIVETLKQPATVRMLAGFAAFIPVRERSWFSQVAAVHLAAAQFSNSSGDAGLISAAAGAGHCAAQRAEWAPSGNNDLQRVEAGRESHAAAGCGPRDGSRQPPQQQPGTRAGVQAPGSCKPDVTQQVAMTTSCQPSASLSNSHAEAAALDNSRPVQPPPSLHGFNNSSATRQVPWETQQHNTLGRAATADGDGGTGAGHADEQHPRQLGKGGQQAHVHPVGHRAGGTGQAWAPRPPHRAAGGQHPQAPIAPAAQQAGRVHAAANEGSGSKLPKSLRPSGSAPEASAAAAVRGASGMRPAGATWLTGAPQPASAVKRPAGVKPAPAVEGAVAKRPKIGAAKVDSGGREPASARNSAAQSGQHATAAVASLAPSGSAPRGSCSMCQKSPMDKAHSSPCGHMGCYSCWLSALAAAFACPVCKRPIRRNQLSPSYFA